MKKIIIALLFSVFSYSQEYVLLEINSTWNLKNSAKIDKVKGVKHVVALLEDQPPSFREKVKSVPLVILYRDNHAVAQWTAGISLKLRITEEDILEAMNQIVRRVATN